MSFKGVELEIRVPCGYGKEHPVRVRYTDWVELEIRVPCTNGEEHPVRVRYTDWDAISCEVVYNPCQEKAHDSPDSPPTCIKMLQDKRVYVEHPRNRDFQIKSIYGVLWENPTHRLALLRGFLEEKAPAAAQMLLKALEDPDPTVAFTAAELLGNFPNDPTISEALVEKIISILRSLYQFEEDKEPRVKDRSNYSKKQVDPYLKGTIPLGRRVLSELLLRRRRRPSFM
jgi:hypothetical protein